MNASKRNVNPEQIIEDLSNAVLSWYEFYRQGTILYISGKEDLLYRKLKAKGYEVLNLSLEESVSASFQRQQKGRISYLIAIGALERSKEPVKALKAWKELLKEDGCLLLGMHNRLGACYFCGERDPYTGRNFDGIENYRRIGPEDWGQVKGRAYAKDQIEDMLEQGGFLGHNFYSVIPSFVHPQLIVSEKYLPKEELSRRIFPAYSDPSTVFLEEEYLYTGLMQNGMFHAMANAYLVECPLDGKGSGARQVTLSADRGPGLAQATILDEKRVIKTALYPQGIGHLKQLMENLRGLEERGLPVVPMEWEGDCCAMPYVEGTSGQRYLHDLAYEDRDEFIKKMDAFRDLILSSSELQMFPVRVSGLMGQKEELGEDGSSQDDLGPQLCLRKGYLDLVPLNTIYRDGTFWIMDQEFVEENLPAAVLLTRLVDLTYEGDQRLESIVPRSFFIERYQLARHLKVWRRKIWSFTAKIRNERELRRFLEASRRNAGAVNSNRQKLNYGTKEYLKLFVRIFDGLEQKKLYLFGAGQFAKQFLAYYHKEYAVEAILDNSQEKWGKTLDGVPVCPPGLLTGLEPGSFKVIICIKNYVGAMKQLEAMGIREYSIFDSSMEYPPVGKQRGRQEAALMQKTRTEAGKKPYHTGYIAGVFDLFHIGHLNLLRRAKEQCEYLIVGVVTDEGVRKNKKTNPFIPFEERLELVRACRYVDEAVEIPLDFASTRDAYQMYHFDVQFSGSDYEENPDWLADKQFLEAQGAKMVFFPYTKSTSSTKLKQRIKETLC